MSNKIIDLGALSEYKSKSDLIYQNKLIAGDSITLNNDVISATPNFTDLSFDPGSLAIGNNETSITTRTLLPGTYYLRFTCQFASNSTGWRYCRFYCTDVDSTSPNYINFYDCRVAVNGTLTQTGINAIFQIPASEFPNGRQFRFSAKKYNATSNTMTAYPRGYYIRF